MPWSLFQRQRLARQRKELEAYFRDKVKWINPADQHTTKVEVTVTLSNDKEYTLRVYLPSDFPNSCPSMIVSLPRCCLKKKKMFRAAKITPCRAKMAAHRSVTVDRTYGGMITLYTR